MQQQLEAADTRLEAVLFLIDAEDFIERPISGGQAQNFEKYRFQGVELTAILQPVEALDLKASYTYTDSENRSADSDTTALQNRPEHKLALRADYFFSPGFRLGGSYLYVADSLAWSRTTPTTTQELDDYHVFDVDLSLSILQGHGRLYGRIANAFDENYEESFGFPQSGRAYLIGAEFRL